MVRKTHRVKQNHTDNSRLLEGQARRIVRASAEAGQHERQTTQTRLQNAQYFREVCRYRFLIRQAGAWWTITHASQIDPQGTEAHLREFSAKADVQVVWTDPVQQTSAQEHENRQLLRVARCDAR